MSWHVKFFTPYAIRDAMRWIRNSKYHIALHENPYAKKFAYHVMGADPESLKEFGREAGCHEDMFSVMMDHGKRIHKGKVVYHFDDWRKGIKEKYEEMANWLDYKGLQD